MDRKAFVALREEVWVRLWDEHDLEVCLVPAEMPDLTMAQVLGKTPQSLSREICRNAFVNFRGWVDDGQPVENTLENRVEMYGFPAIHNAVNNHLAALNAKVLQGEGDAASD